jgi:hypothetical protein
MCGVSTYLKGEDMMKLRKLGALATACGLFALVAIGYAHADNWYQLLDSSGFSTVSGNGNKFLLGPTKYVSSKRCAMPRTTPLPTK